MISYPGWRLFFKKTLRFLNKTFSLNPMTLFRNCLKQFPLKYNSCRCMNMFLLNNPGYTSCFSIYIFRSNSNNQQYGFKILLRLWRYILHYNHVGIKFLVLIHKLLWWIKYWNVIFDRWINEFYIRSPTLIYFRYVLPVSHLPLFYISFY